MTRGRRFASTLPVQRVPQRPLRCCALVTSGVGCERLRVASRRRLRGAAVSAPVTAAEDVWSEESTSPDAIERALRDLLRQRHAANEGLAPAPVLNLVVIIDRDSKREVSNRLERVGRYHASRTILCAG